jgi:glutamate formiminotransferase/formiminotetrahydrofolate cyclodeaminase
MSAEQTLAAFGDEVAAGTPAPGGGAVAAVCGALAAALVAMVGRLALVRESAPGLADLVAEADQLRGRLLELAEQDAAAYGEVIRARQAGDGAALAAAWRTACQVPDGVIRACGEVTRLARRAARDGLPTTVGDAVMAALLAAAAAEGSHINLRLNAQASGRPEALRVLADHSEVILRDTRRAAEEARLVVEERLGRG